MNALLAATVFPAFFLCAWLVVNPRLLYFWTELDFPAFRRGPAYWHEMSARPGGPVRYLAAILAQTYYLPWAGAAVQTAVGALLCAALAVLGRRSGRRAGLLALVPAVMLLALQCRYVFAMEAVLALCVAALAALACVGEPPRSRPVAVALFAALAAGVYWAAAGMVLVFAGICAACALRRRRWGSAVLAVAAAAVVPFAWGVGHLGLRPLDACWPLLPVVRVDSRWLAVLLGALCLYPVLLAAVAGTEPGTQPKRQTRADLPRLAGAGVLLALLAATAWLTPDHLVRDLLRAEAAGRTGDWEGVLAAARRIPRGQSSYKLSFGVNRALWHEGRLLDGMFGFPQAPLGLLQTPEDAVFSSGDPGVLLALSDVYYDLGRMNEAEQLAQEVIAMRYRPWIAERIARARIAKGEADAARAFLNAVAQDLVYGPRALVLLACLDGHGCGDQPIVRPWATPEDEAERLTVEAALESLIGPGPAGGMALDYLVALRLLTGDTGGLMSLLPTMAERGWTDLPRHCEEAVLVHMARAGTNADLRGFAVSPDTAARFADFLAVLRSYSGQPEVLSRVMDERFGETYFHYYYSGRYGPREEAPPP